MTQHNLKPLFLATLKDIYHAEKQILEGLPKMVQHAGNPELREALETHRAETADQVSRLEEVFRAIGEQPAGEECEAIKGLIEEASEVMEMGVEPEVLDAGIIAAGQAIEHYEMARYGTLKAWAEQMDMPDAARLLDQTLEEEKNADRLLNDIALNGVNQTANAA